MAPNEVDQAVLHAIGYHQQTKHHFFRYARALGYMDWANQPDPFRRFEGAPLHWLPLLGPRDYPVGSSYDALYGAGAVPVQPVTIETLSRFFEHALAITAWKEAGGARWALRSNPSSGNLHPTEGYLLIDAVAGLHEAPALYHYAAKEHGLERRADWPTDEYQRLLADFPPGAFVVALTSVHWREAWKYGERAYRYCQHDAGHAIGTMRIAARTLGWKFLLLEGVGDDTLSRLLGLDRDEDFAGVEPEHPDCLAVVWPPGREAACVPSGLARMPQGLDGRGARIECVRWHGRANRLSRREPDPWDIIDVVAAACRKPSLDRPAVEVPASDVTLGVADEGERAGDVIRRRRSALAFDGTTPLPASRFFTMLGRVMPEGATPRVQRPMPWDGWPWEAAVDLGLFVHRVDGLAPGLYWLARDPQRLEDLRVATHAHFAWTKAPGAPGALPLYLLEAGDGQRLAMQVSCHQEIAASGAFSLGMIARFEPTLRRHGAWFYRRLFWETGLIGQVLYLEAEAAGVRATGIGCFFDDPVHQVFGLSDLRYQSLYHFTVGGPVEDPRLTTLPAYEKAGRHGSVACDEGDGRRHV